jgi:hypothetical protein
MRRRSAPPHTFWVLNSYICRDRYNLESPLLSVRCQANLPENEETSLVYDAIADGFSQVLGLRLEVEDALIGFYQQDNGEKLLIPSELQTQRAEIAEQEVQKLRDRLAALDIE